MRWSIRLASLLGVLLPLLSSAAAAQVAPEDSLLTRANESRRKGSAEAPITIIELADFQCPFCREFNQLTMPALDSLYVRTGKARIVFYNLPFPSHSRSWVAAEAAMCAAAQGSFWPMHDRLYDEQALWGESTDPAAEFDRYATALSLNLDAFRDCTRQDRVAPLLLTDLIQGTNGGVSATPTFVILREPRAGEDPNAAQRVLAGMQPIAEFEKAIAELSR
ncbi:MAG: DsbA family protein [Gemmatimonadetes bacterium]|nr:DsbA family protein [Gemmatimonadota bacterium]